MSDTHPARRTSHADSVAIILSVGMATALNLFTAAAILDAFVNPDAAGLSENATQILTGWGGGVVGVIGAVVGYRAGQQSGNTPTEKPPA